MTNAVRRRPRAAGPGWTLALALALSVAPASAHALDDPALEQEIDRSQDVSTEPAVIADGHVDIGPRYVDDLWMLLVHDDTSEPSVWRPMADAVFHVGDTALLTVPEGDAYAFVPAPAGTDVHVLPQVQQPGVVWLGWNTQDPTVMETIDRGATLRLRGVQGPGEMVMFLQSGDLSEPDIVWDSRVDYPQDMWVETNTHAHANWVFSTPGVYLVEVEVAADVVTGEHVSDTQVIRFAVGDETDTEQARAAEYVRAEPAEADGPAGADGDGQPDVVADDGSSGGVALELVIAAAGGVILLAALTTVLVRGRGVKRRAELEHTPGGES